MNVLQERISGIDISPNEKSKRIIKIPDSANSPAGKTTILTIKAANTE